MDSRGTICGNEYIYCWNYHLCYSFMDERDDFALKCDIGIYDFHQYFTKRAKRFPTFAGF